MASGLLTINGVAGSGPAYTLTVTSSAGIASGDHVVAPLLSDTSRGGVYRVDTVPTGSTIAIIDDLVPGGGAYGAPFQGLGAYWTPTLASLSAAKPNGCPFWGDITERDLLIIDVGVVAPWVSFIYADATERTTATGFTPEDVNKVAWQMDNNTFWFLKDVAPTWISIGANAAPALHASTHESGGSDEIQHQNLAGAGTNTHVQIDTHITKTTVLNGVGNPNGLVSGFQGQTYRDIGNNVFYKCTTDSTTNWEVI